VTTSRDGSSVYVAGYVHTGGFLAAYDATTGVLQWRRRDGGPGADFASLAVDGVGTVYATTRHLGSDGLYRFLTLAINGSDGQKEWAATYHTPGLYNDQPAALAMSPDDAALYVTGTTGDQHGLSRGLLIAYAANSGMALWVARCEGPRGYVDIRGLAATPDGSEVVQSGGEVGRGYRRRLLTIGYDPQTGAKLWRATYGSPHHYIDWDGFAQPTVGGAVFVSGEMRNLQGGGSAWITVAYATA
jgi:hypothetical protein